MRNNVSKILRRLPLNLKESGTDVELHWTTNSGGTPDPVTGAVTGGTDTAQTLTVQAFAFEMNIATAAQAKLYSDLEVGSVIMDFAPAVALDGKAGLRFKFDGRWFEQGRVSSKLAQTWDAVASGRKLFRRVLLKPAT